MKIKFDELCIQEAEAFYKLLLDEIENLQGNPLILDFSNIEKIDLSTIQILISLKKYCESINMDLILINMNSSQVQQTINTFKLNSSLGLEL